MFLFFVLVVLVFLLHHPSTKRVEVVINVIEFIVFCSFWGVIYIHCTEYFVLHSVQSN